MISTVADGKRQQFRWSAPERSNKIYNSKDYIKWSEPTITSTQRIQIPGEARYTKRLPTHAMLPRAPPERQQPKIGGKTTFIEKRWGEDL